MLALVALLFALTQFQQRLFRYRAERLVADFRTIRVYKSTWTDAQRLMTRWGAWGHYEGSCTATACAYQINLLDAGSKLLGWHNGRGLDEIMRFWLDDKERWLRDWIYNPVRGRAWGLSVQFIVRSGVIEETRIMLSVESTSNLDHETVYGNLVVIAHSVNSYRGTMGLNAQLATHPEYRVGHPQSCISCLMANISYLPTIGDAELRSLTDFDYSCLTRFRECVILEQLLPTTRAWNLYFYPWGEHRYDNSTAAESPLPPCSLPVWTLGRDAAIAFVVNHFVRETRDAEPSYNGRIVELLHSAGRWDSNPKLYLYGSGTAVIHPNIFSGAVGPEKRYIVLGNEMMFSGIRPPIRADWCSVLEDTPDNREQLRRGFAIAEAHHASQLPTGPWFMW